MKRNPLPPLSSEVEVEAIETLLSLPNLIKKYELLSQYSFTWGIKKKRSVLVNRKVTSSSVVLDADKSPSTPLCFVNSDGGSDGFDKTNKPLPSLSFKKILKKKLVDDLKVKLSGMQEENDKLKRDIASMEQKKQELQAQNLELKAKRQKISYTRNMEDMQLWNNPMKMNLDQHVQQRYHHHQQQISMFAPQQQQQQYMVDPNTGKVMTMSCSSNIDSGGSRFGLFNQIEPRVQRETYDFMSKSQPLDHGKYMVIDNDLRARNCAAARKRRISRMKENKNSLLNMRLSRGSR
ncbi:hypothetical protein CTI12_AA298890 [Artemisia annua]|uniref:Uncharacterized protein n=1 Tax=Artemisia annua TaxID=35608 RepID=A0A2U1N0L9_ARTAN|nr:hypothetical protein CTI12_AA298890 [Artemisia annua]